MTKQKQPTRQTVPSVAYRLVERLVSLPRWARIGLAAVFALLLTLLLMPVIDSIYMEYFYSPDTRDVAAYVASAFGVVMYVTGWRLIVGFTGESPKVSPAVLWYVSLGAAASLIALALFVFGAVTGAQ